MPKVAYKHTSTPEKLPKVLSKALKTIRREARARKKRRRPRLPILATRHITKKEWQTRTAAELSAAREKLMSLTSDQTFVIESASSEGKTYDVTCDSDGAWSCTCPDYKFRHSKLQCQYGFYCKHIAVCVDKFMK